MRQNTKLRAHTTSGLCFTRRGRGWNLEKKLPKPPVHPNSIFAVCPIRAQNNEQTTCFAAARKETRVEIARPGPPSLPPLPTPNSSPSKQTLFEILNSPRVRNFVGSLFEHEISLDSCSNFKFLKIRISMTCAPLRAPMHECNGAYPRPDN